MTMATERRGLYVTTVTRASEPLSRGQKNRDNICQQADNSFGRYKKESPQEVRKADVQENAVLKELRNIYARFKYGQDNVDTAYIRVLELISNLSVSAKDIECFTIALAEFQDEKWFAEKAGLMLSALINNGNEEDYTISTKYLIARPQEAVIYHLGFRNTKNIIIEGNDITRVGHKMQRGTIIVKGDVSAYAALEMEGGTIIVEGYGDYAPGHGMRGGELIIKGDTGPYVGDSMTGGKIHVLGNVISESAGKGMQGGVIIMEGNGGLWVAPVMRGGEIYLNGDYASIADNMYGGKIFHKGKLIFPIGE